MTKLLSRDEFRELGFERDNHTCVWCKATNVKLDFHHLVGRREFKAPQELGGYILSNGVSLCSKCHLLAEMTVVSCEELRQAAGIEEVILPEHYYPDHTYTKWGDVVLEDGRRTPGPYFYDKSVHYYKYCRSYHHLDSEGKTSDDKTISNDAHLIGKEIVITIKMDGECFPSTARITLPDLSTAAMGDLYNNKDHNYVLVQDISGNIKPVKILKRFKKIIPNKLKE